MGDGTDRNQDVSIHSASDNTQKIELQHDGSIYRVPVDANIEGGVQLEKFSPQFDYSVANTALSDVSYTTLFSLTGTVGRLAFIQLACSKSDYTIKLTIDSILRLTISMNDLGSNLGLTSSVGTTIPIYTAIANKNFVYNPLVPVDFEDGFKVEAIKTVPQTTTINWMITYRTLI